jgi:hypothetical protein
VPPCKVHTGSIPVVACWAVLVFSDQSHRTGHLWAEPVEWLDL